MEIKTFTPKECIDAAEKDCVKAGRPNLCEVQQTLYMASIAESLLAIAKMANEYYQIPPEER